MTEPQSSFNEEALLRDLRHFLPAQAPLKDYVYVNSLKAFQDKPFFEGLKAASDTFGYRTFLNISEFRKRYHSNLINHAVTDRVIVQNQGAQDKEVWLDRMLNKEYDENVEPKIGLLRSYWKTSFNMDLESFIQPKLFRILCSYLDQGVSIWDFPVDEKGFLASLRALERTSYSSFFRTKRVKELFFNEGTTIGQLLDILVGDPTLYHQYIFDQQFAHQGWSGMVAVVEARPNTLLISRKIELKEVILFELLLELDTLDARLKTKWKPLREVVVERPRPLFSNQEVTELDIIHKLWQEAFEWSFYDQVLIGIQSKKVTLPKLEKKAFQAAFCIDDREGSFRRYLERFEPTSETYGTPGFFGVEFYFQPLGGKFYTKVCPAPIFPKYLIKEVGVFKKQEKDLTFSKNTHNFLAGWLVTQTLGFWSAFKLFVSIFKPSMGPSATSSLRHMDKNSGLIIENKSPNHRQGDLQVGFTKEEMATRVENVLHSIGLVKDFAPIVYIIGHGASSVNNPYYAAYDCVACSGRAGSVNARVFSHMANDIVVRAELRKKGIDIPVDTQFIGGIHDTTRDEVVFFDVDTLFPENQKQHEINESTFAKALDYNAKERSRRFDSINSKQSPSKIHEQILIRSVSLFQPRPELDHATNAMCIVGRRELSKGLFLDRRSFLNSYDHKLDPEGNYLLNILNAATPVCGSTNLVYYFSRVDNQKLGAGSKLPHNVMGLFGLANGIDGDLRPGLASQMIEVHDPIRLLMVIEQYPEMVADVIRRNPATFEWYANEWVVLVVVHPETRETFLFKEMEFHPYHTVNKDLPHVTNIDKLVESHEANFPVFIID